jgi:AcrR family transcriptional regulator
MNSAHDPRANQKQRTRAAIVEAAAELLRSGAELTVAAAAEAARVSRATAYRYFPTPESLQLEVAGVTPAYAEVEQLVQSLEGEDTEARLLRFIERVTAVSFAEEARMRMALKVYLDTWFAARGGTGSAPPVREGRRMRWLEQVLEPARLGRSKSQWRRLQAALALTVGADAMVVMKDVCRLDEQEAQEVLRWAARALLRAGLDELPASARGRAANSARGTPRA